MKTQVITLIAGIFYLSTGLLGLSYYSKFPKEARTKKFFLGVLHPIVLAVAGLLMIASTILNVFTEFSFVLSLIILTWIMVLAVANILKSKSENRSFILVLMLVNIVFLLEMVFGIVPDGLKTIFTFVYGVVVVGVMFWGVSKRFI
jgi:hypothetical protein